MGRPAEIDLCWKAVGGWQDLVRLQHSEGVHPSLGAASQGRCHRTFSPSSCPEIQLNFLWSSYSTLVGYTDMAMIDLLNCEVSLFVSTNESVIYSVELTTIAHPVVKRKITCVGQVVEFGRRYLYGLQCLF